MKQVRILLLPNLYSRYQPEGMPQGSVSLGYSEHIGSFSGQTRAVMVYSFGGNCVKRFYGFWGYFNPWLGEGGEGGLRNVLYGDAPRRSKP